MAAISENPKKRIVLTGGGTAGHVVPNLVLWETLSKGWLCHYLGSYGGIEKELVGSQMPYHAIQSGKLRRYFDLKNLTDLFRIFWGTVQAFYLLRKIKPGLVFSKGGFVSVPVVAAAWILRIPVVLHEADLTPGLANRLSIPFARKICTAFEETLKHLPANKSIHTGLPIRKVLYRGEATTGLKLCGFSPDKPCLLVMGGSLGAEAVNRCLREALNALLPAFQIAHLCGRGKTSRDHLSVDGYKQFEYVSDELPHLLAMCEAVVSRAGANSIFELLALRKPNLLIPLSLKASRGDQILNARTFEKKGYSLVLPEEKMTSHSLTSHLFSLHRERHKYMEMMAAFPLQDPTQKIVDVIESLAI